MLQKDFRVESVVTQPAPGSRSGDLRLYPDVGATGSAHVEDQPERLIFIRKHHAANHMLLGSLSFPP